MLGDDAGRRRRGFVVISRDNFDSLFDSYFLDFSDAFNSRTSSVYSRDDDGDDGGFGRTHEYWTPTF